MSVNMQKITLIVPTRNEEKNIPAFLKSLPDALKLIIVDSSSDHTVALIRRLRPDRTHIIQKKCNIPQARQTGAEAANSPWLLFSDADSSFDPDYFTRLNKLDVPPAVGAIMGAKLSLDRFKLYFKLYSLSIGLYARIGLPMGSGSNMLIRREALQKTGGFDPALSAGEDTYMLWQIKKAGYRVIYDGRLKVYETDHRRLEKGVFKKIFHGTGRAFMLFSGLGGKTVRKSDWGYWNKEPK